eukprot:TRINITY_DN16616_c0_g1_i13.p1 TRINITY_DN16616_c0_g1~~TRINITY_DN16616_c0_g1_i13.p1  ORF type:complete len:901 (-),score=264.27 TRINITY_DN16616_c0_g1_i13:104-2806(-)
MDQVKVNPSQLIQAMSCYDKLSAKLKAELAKLKSLDTFFKELCYLNESYGKSLQSLLSHLPAQQSDTSFQVALSALSKRLQEFAQVSISSFKELQAKVLPSLEQFRTAFDKQLTKLLKMGSSLLSEISDLRKGAANTRDSYIRSAKSYEKAQNEVRDVINSIQSDNFPSAALESKASQMLDLKLTTDSNFINYRNEVERANELIKVKYAECYNLLESMLQLEEGRIEFEKEIIHKNLKSVANIAQVYIDKINSVTTVVECVNSASDIKIFLNGLTEERANLLFDPIECNKVKLGLESMEPSLGTLGNEKGVSDIRKTIVENIKKLLQGSTLSLEEKAVVIEQLHKPLGMEVFANVLLTIKQPKLVDSEVFKVFAELLTCLLTAFMLEKDSNNNVLLAVLSASRVIYTKVEGKIRYLFADLARHGIWEEMNRWQSLIKNCIERRVEETRIVVLQQKIDLETEDKRGLLKRLKSTYLLNIKKVPETDEEMYRVASSTAEQVLSQFVFFFSNLRINFSQAYSLLRHFGSTYGISSARMYELGLKLKASQPLSIADDVDYPKEFAAQRKLERRMCKYGGSVLLFCIGLSIPFNACGKDLLNLLLLNKKCYSVLKIPVFKHLLLKLNTEVTLSQRLQIWEQVINVKEFDCSYDEVKEKVRSSSLSPSKSIRDLIAMDVLRSIPHNKALDHDSLVNILLAYAIHNKQVEYCQGMNFIAGYLLLLFQDESKAFRFLACLIEKHQMSDLFSQGVPLLKRHLYKLDRLVHIHCPEVSEYFRNNNLNSSLFASAWFITLFSYSVQETTEAVPPLMLLKLWDAFLLTGWKALFKMGIYIIREAEATIFGSKFEEVMMTLSMLPRRSLMQGGEEVHRMVNFITSIKVTNRVLEQFDSEYRPQEALEEPFSPQ